MGVSYIHQGLVVSVGTERESLLHWLALGEAKQSTSVEKCFFMKALSNPVPLR